MHEDIEASTIDTVAVFVVVVVVVVAAAADDDDYDNDDGEKEINQFITYYFSNTWRFATEIHLLKIHCLKNKVPHPNETHNMVHNRYSMHKLFKLLHVYDHVTK